MYDNNRMPKFSIHNPSGGRGDLVDSQFVENYDAYAQTKSKRLKRNLAQDVKPIIKDTSCSCACNKNNGLLLERKYVT